MLKTAHQLLLRHLFDLALEGRRCESGHCGFVAARNSTPLSDDDALAVLPTAPARIADGVCIVHAGFVSRDSPSQFFSDDSDRHVRSSQFRAMPDILELHCAVVAVAANGLDANSPDPFCWVLGLCRCLDGLRLWQPSHVCECFQGVGGMNVHPTVHDQGGPGEIRPPWGAALGT